MRVTLKLPMLLVDGLRRSLGLDLVEGLRPLMVGPLQDDAGALLIPLDLTESSIELPMQLEGGLEIAIGIAGEQVEVLFPSFGQAMLLLSWWLPPNWTVREEMRAGVAHLRVACPLAKPMTMNLPFFGEIGLRPS